MARPAPVARLLTEVYERLFQEYGPQHWWPGDTPFEVVAGAILTQNSAWSNAEKALDNLKAAGALEPQAIRDMRQERLARLLRPSGYFNSKATKLKAVVEWLRCIDDDFARLGEWEAKALRAELLGVHGIGPETADVLVLYVAGLPSFVIDAYTMRILERLAIEVLHPTYEGYQRLFEENLPLDVRLYNEFHALLDVHAASTCRKREPRCAECCLLEVCRYGRQRMDGATAT